MAEQQNIQERIIKKAWENADFKKELLSDPKAALQRELEMVIPDDIEIKVVEETPKTFYIVIPANPAEQKGSLETSGDLEAQTPY